MGRPLPLGLKVLHWAIIVLLATNVLYGGWQVFVTLAPEGVTGPLWGAASGLSHEHLVARRLYAIEVWISFAGLAVYLGVTEILPRRLGRADP